MKMEIPVANHKATISRACAKKMKDPKTTMHDESLIFVYKEKIYFRSMWDCYDSRRDKEYENPWIGCNKEGCNA